jgi:methylmalonyl-CoA decarboxylase subunit alpha
MGEVPDKEALGGARTQARAGAVDNVAADEDDALEQVRRFLSYLPDNVCGRRRSLPLPTRASAESRS